MRKHVLIVTGLVVAISAGLVALLLNTRLLPPEAAAEAPPVDRIFYWMLMVAAVIFALCLVTMVYSAIVFRRRRGDATEGPLWYGHNGLEITWTVIPLIIVMFFSVYGAKVLAQTTRPSGPIPDVQVTVTASQWSWRFEYPDYKITASELRLPVNRPVLLRLHATDVIHSFWVPEFRPKQDAVPGLETFLRVTPDRIGDFKVQCAEMCGFAHAYMVAPVKVVDQAAFDQWVKEQQQK